jgi:hypothetical protein
LTGSSAMRMQLAAKRAEPASGTGFFHLTIGAFTSKLNLDFLIFLFHQDQDISKRKGLRL